jgi:hypothetical protein
MKKQTAYMTHLCLQVRVLVFMCVCARTSELKGITGVYLKNNLIFDF